MKGKENRAIRKEEKKKRERENKCISKGENECTVSSPHVNPSLPITLNTCFNTSTPPPGASFYLNRNCKN